MVPPYANIFMHYIDLDIKDISERISHFRRYLDDIFFLFQGTLAEIQQLEIDLNKIHPTIKFTLTYSLTDTNFLDLHIYLNKHRKLKTTLYRKPTDCQMYTHYNSNHPTYIKHNIIYNQALRLNKLIDNDNELSKHLHILTKALLAQNYPLDIINQNIMKALTHSQQELLHPTPRVPQDPSIYHNTVKINYSTNTSNIKRFVNKYTTETTERANQQNLLIPPKINCTYTNHKKLEDLLLHSDVLYKTPKTD